MSSDDASATPEKTVKGPITRAIEAQDVAARRFEERDARQDARTDKAWEKAVEAAERSSASKDKTIRMLGGLVFSLIIILAMLVAGIVGVGATGHIPGVGDITISKTGTP